MSSYRKQIYNLFLIVSIILFAGSVSAYIKTLFAGEKSLPRIQDPFFDPALARIDNMPQLIGFTDSLASVGNFSDADHQQYTALADRVVRMRFTYGLQKYQYHENYLAWLGMKIFWSHLGVKVLPEDILQGSKAFCSQSAMVFQEILRKKEIPFRTVGLQGHYCTEVWIDDTWQFHDVSYKPDANMLSGISTDSLLSNRKIIHEAYATSFAKNLKTDITDHFDASNIFFGEINAPGAPQMAMFQKTTKFLSWWGWVFLFIIIVYKLLSKKIN